MHESVGEIEGFTEPREVHTVTADLAATVDLALLESVVSGADVVLSGLGTRSAHGTGSASRRYWQRTYGGWLLSAPTIGVGHGGSWVCAGASARTMGSFQVCT